MRYRPFGKSGQVVSAVSLRLDSGLRRSAKDWRNLTGLALEAGINSFEIVGDAPAAIEGAAQALADVERELLVVSWRAPAAADPARAVGGFLEVTGLEHLDFLVLDGAADPAQQALRAARRLRAFTLDCRDETDDARITAGDHQAVIVPYSPISGWKDRNRLKAAADRDMAVFARDVWPEALRPKPAPILKKALFGGRANPLAGAGTYQFLETTAGWTPEEICLAYVLTETAVTSVQVEAADVNHLQRLADVAERDLPAGVAAQVEMARFSVASA